MMSFEKPTPKSSDVGGEFQPTPDESQLSHGPGNNLDKEAQLEDDAPPDGGAAAWLVVLGGWCCSFNSMGWMNSKMSLFF
jgi:MFS transporter, MCT family, aspergillic acid transporter